MDSAYIYLTAKTYYSDVVRIYDQIIRGKDIDGVWRNPCAGIFMLSPSHKGSHEVYSSLANKCSNMGAQSMYYIGTFCLPFTKISDSQKERKCST